MMNENKFKLENNNSNSQDDYGTLKLGDKLPDFRWKDETGHESLSFILKGKPTLIILFAAGCRHCRDNFAFLEQNLFSKKLQNLNILAFGRECDSGQLDFYKKKYALSIKLIADPDKEIYSKFAQKAIPRNYLFDSEGSLVFSIRGFRSDKINELISIISTCI